MTHPIAWHLIYTLSLLVGTIVYLALWLGVPLGYLRPRPYRLVFITARRHADGVST